MARMYIFFFVVMMVATPDGKVQAESIDIEKILCSMNIQWFGHFLQFRPNLRNAIILSL